LIGLRLNDTVTIVTKDTERQAVLTDIGWNPEDGEMEIGVQHEPFCTTHYFVRDVAITDVDEIRIMVA
jgi:hypothetical protein